MDLTKFVQYLIDKDHISKLLFGIRSINGWNYKLASAKLAKNRRTQKLHIEIKIHDPGHIDPFTTPYPFDEKPTRLEKAFMRREKLNRIQRHDEVVQKPATHSVAEAPVGPETS